MVLRISSLALSWLIFALGWNLPAKAATSDFYKGKSIVVIVSTDAGTGYDIYARTIARHWANHIPGKPNIIVQNLTGAGGLRAANLLYNVSANDGLTVGLVQSTVPFEPFFGNTAATFDPLKFNWLGTPSQEVLTLIVWHTVPVRTLAEAQKRGLTLAATGGASTPAFYARVLSNFLKFPIRLIAGYKSQNDVFLGMEREENDGSAAVFYSTLKVNKPDWLAERKAIPLLQYGRAPDPELPNVPFVMDLLTAAEDREAMEIATAPLSVGRPLMAPPNVDPERVNMLRAALEKTFKDKDYLADCAKQLIACDTPLDGNDIAGILQRTYQAKAQVRERLVRIYDGRE
jgi:tripartite-type tricarboxylate transporter receptor subunit TctC